jgi:hypothetical protein
LLIRAIAASLLMLAAGLVSLGVLAPARPLSAGAPLPITAAQTDPVIAAAGDIACDPGDANFNHGDGTAALCHMKATADLIVSRSPTAVLALGDTQYENGAPAKFQQSYDPTWGRFKAITHPVVGNHEYGTPGASGYFSYFGTAAGEPGKGYYSFDIGAWHAVVLNGNCGDVGGCAAGSPQERWLRDDLAANAGKACVLAAWHQPRFSSGLHGSNPAYDAFFRDLYDARADLILNGHDHTYERFAPQDPRGDADPGRGIREFVIGTGGRSHYPFVSIKPHSEVRNRDAYGVLVVTLHPSSYDWEFVPERGKTFTDTGSARCTP